MTLLDDIVSGASGDVSVATLLRQLKVLASRTGSDRLADWVNDELNGYESEETLPPYRGPFKTMVLGDFYGVAGSGVKNMPIPAVSFPADMRDSGLFCVSLPQSVAEIEDMARDEHRTLTWSADAIQYYNYGIATGIIQRIVREDMALASVSRPVPRSIFVGVLDAVRNRVLDLALELEEFAPQAGQPDATAEIRSEAAAVINNYNFGTAANVAIGSSNVAQTVSLPAAGDRDALLRYLGAVGVHPRLVIELEEAIVADAAQGEGQGGDFGPRVKGWLARSSTQLGTGVATGVVVAALKAFFGI